MKIKNKKRKKNTTKKFILNVPKAFITGEFNLGEYNIKTGFYTDTGQFFYIVNDRFIFAITNVRIIECAIEYLERYLKDIDNHNSTAFYRDDSQIYFTDLVREGLEKGTFKEFEKPKEIKE